LTKAEREHLDKVAALGCIICRRMGYADSPAEIHHIRTGIGAGNRATHWQTIGVCPEHHRGNSGIHGLGRKGFEKRYGITELELLDEIKRLIGCSTS
jgi:hypothetical protein